MLFKNRLADRLGSLFGEIRPLQRRQPGGFDMRGGFHTSVRHSPVGEHLQGSDARLMSGKVLRRDARTCMLITVRTIFNAVMLVLPLNFGRNNVPWLPK
jgi:hypothetical protein